MRFKKWMSLLLAVAMVFGLTGNMAYAAVEKDEAGNIFYVPTESGVYSKGDYTVEKISHPTLGAGEIDGILTGEDQDRGNSYSWSMAEYGDYVYIGTCYNSTYYIYHNNVQTAIKSFQSQGILDSSINASEVADKIVGVAFGVDTFDKSQMSDWEPVIMAVHKVTGEAKIIFNEREVWADYPEIFPGYSPYLATKNYLSGYRMAFEFQDKIYFAGMGTPTATLVEIDPTTNETNISYYNINMTRGVANGVHGLLVYDDEILMCLATDNYDGNGTPGGIIVASDNPSAGLSEWRVIADQDDFDGLPAIMQIDGLNGGGIWDIIEYNGDLYVTVVTDKTDAATGITNKQGFALYRGEKDAEGNFSWTQVIGDQTDYDFGLGINYSMACNMWVYDDHLYLGTYNDPMLDLAQVAATGNFEHLYNDLDHSIYLYRMDAEENFEQVAGKDDNPYFPEGPIGNLGEGLGNNSNQYVWRYGVHNDELYIGTYDTSTLTYMFTQITDGQVENMDYEDISSRADSLKSALLDILQEQDNEYLSWILDLTLFSDYTAKLYQQLAGFATDMSADKNPVPEYRKMQENYETKKARVYALLEGKMNSKSFVEDYQNQTEVAMFADPTDAPEDFVNDLRDGLKAEADKIFEVIDKAVYDETIHNFVYYFGVNYYAQQCERGFDLLVSKDGVNFDAITRDGFGDAANHGLRTICSTEYGVYLGTANPYYGTQLWLLSGAEDAERVQEEEAPFEDVNKEDYFYDATIWAAEEGITTGQTDKLFGSLETVTRADFITFLYRALKGEAGAGECPFEDVNAEEFYYDAMLWAVENGITNGTTEKTFDPYAQCTREQIVTLLWRALEKSKAAEKAEEMNFVDVDAAEYYYQAILWASENGVTKGQTENTFGVSESCTRADSVLFIQRALVK